MMKRELRQLHQTIVDLVGLMNKPQRDTELLEEASVTLDRALFPLLVAIEREGPIGVVELAGLAGRDYTTVSRQVAKLETLGMITRRASKTDKRMRQAKITAKGRKILTHIDQARERLTAVLFANWTQRDLQNLARLMRRFLDDFQTLQRSERPEHKFDLIALNTLSAQSSS